MLTVIDATKGYNVSESFIYNVCDKDGFVRLPKCGKSERLELMGISGYAEVLQATESEACTFAKSEKIASNGVGVLCFLPFIKAYGVRICVREHLKLFVRIFGAEQGSRTRA